MNKIQTDAEIQNNHKHIVENIDDNETSIASESSEPKVMETWEMQQEENNQHELSMPTTSDNPSNTTLQSKLHQTNMPPPPQRKNKKKKRNKYRHVQNDSHSAISSMHCPHSVLSQSGANVTQSGWNYQNYRTALRQYNYSNNSANA